MYKVSQLAAVSSKSTPVAMQWQRFLSLFLLVVVLDSGLAQQTADGAANAKTKEVLAYIAGLPKQGRHKEWTSLEQETVDGLLCTNRESSVWSICRVQSGYIQHSTDRSDCSTNRSNTSDPRLRLGLRMELQDTAREHHWLFVQSLIESALEQGWSRLGEHALA